MALYALYLTNKYGFKLKKVSDNAAKKALRLEYSDTLFSRLNIDVTVTGADKMDPNGQYLLISNHQSIIDPCIIEQAMKDTNILGLWISKKELYNSFFFGKFVRNGGSILLDRESKQMGQFFKTIKEELKQGKSIFVFPEGTRNIQGTDLTDFKEGSQLIAVKNRLPILPVHIKGNITDILRRAITKREKGLSIEVEIGHVIDCKDRSMSLEQAYRKTFELKEQN
jgi:1-acyl-sn-glycerol-3-phosphate acyltransferase